MTLVEHNSTSGLPASGVPRHSEGGSGHGQGGFTEDENQTLLLLRSNKEKLLADIQQIRREITEVTSRMNELQSEVDRHTEPKVLDAIELFNQGQFPQCFARLAEVNATTSTSANGNTNNNSSGINRQISSSNTEDSEATAENESTGVNRECSPEEKANFLSSNMAQLDLEKFHKYLYKPNNQLVMRNFLLAVPIQGLTLLDSVRKCFASLLFNEAESDVITRIYRYISESYFLQNPEEAEKVFGCEDACEFAAGAIVFINTSMNNNNVKDKMTEDDFASYGQCREVKEMTPNGIPKDYLVSVYRELKKNPLQLRSANYSPHKSVLKQGSLYKEGGQYRTWKKRFFVLHSDFLYYYVNPQDEKPKGIIVLANLDVRPTGDSSRKFCFELVSRESRDRLPQVIKATKATEGGTHVKGKHSRYIMSASSEEERDEWIVAIKDTLKVDMVYALLQWRQNNKLSQHSSLGQASF